MHHHMTRHGVHQRSSAADRAGLPEEQLSPRVLGTKGTRGPVSDEGRVTLEASFVKIKKRQCTSRAKPSREGVDSPIRVLLKSLTDLQEHFEIRLDATIGKLCTETDDSCDAGFACYIRTQQCEICVTFEHPAGMFHLTGVRPHPHTPDAFQHFEVINVTGSVLDNVMFCVFVQYVVT